MTTQSHLEQVLANHGDHLFQSALLLTLEHGQAERLLLQTMRGLAATPRSASNRVELAAALLAALPAKQRPVNRLPWASDPLQRAIAHLPPVQRLALDLHLRYDDEPQRLAPLFAGSTDEATRSLHSALLALVPTIEPESLPVLAAEDAPDVCRQTRFTLAASPGAMFDPQIRAHLATCAACRSAEQAWGRVRIAAEGALRTALRDVELPSRTGEQARALLDPQVAVAAAGRRINPRLLQIGLPLLVLALVGLLVLPRSNNQLTAGGAAAVGAATEPRQLVQRALDSLYTPLANTDVWHGTYEMRWSFSERVYATLVGDVWSSGGANPQQFRSQLVHADGGAPYEFALMNGQFLWYSSTALYGRSVYGRLHDQFPDQVRINITPEDQQALVAGRFKLGAWHLPEHYLRQALAADTISTWGRQRAADGSEQMVLGIAGFSPLGLPPGVPKYTPLPTTILLTIDTASGRLREVREVSGPAGGEQVGRTVWRMTGDQAVTDEIERATVFNAERSYNGGGRFQPIADSVGVADPLLPMIPASAVQQPTQLVTTWQNGPRLPRVMPAETDRIVVVASNPYSDSNTVYLGNNRLLVVRQNARARADMSAFRELATDFREIQSTDASTRLLVPGSGLRYGLDTTYIVADNDGFLVGVEGEAWGFKRDEILAVADSMALFRVENYMAQAAAFRTPEPHDPAARELLLAALDFEPVAEDQAWHIVEQTFQRQGPLVDSLSDPYHMPYYAGITPETTTEVWTRRQQPQGLEIAWQRRNQKGEVINQSLESVNGYFWYDKPSNQVYTGPRDLPPDQEPINEPIWTVINLLGCGGTTLETLSDGTRVITQIDKDWYRASCNREAYAGQLYVQQINNEGRAGRPPPFPNGYYDPNTPPDTGPYLLDLAGQPFYHRLLINQAGQAFRYEVRASTADGELVEAVERTVDRRVPASEAPAAPFDPTPPDALRRSSGYPDDRQGSAPLFVDGSDVVSMTDVLSGFTTPVWYIPPSETVEMRRISALKHASRWPTFSDNVFEDAFSQGFAVRFTYGPPDGDTNRLAQTLYVGDAEQFAAYLRTRREWRLSFPRTVIINARVVEAWEVSTDETTYWTLLELDGTLIVLDTSTPERRARLDQLRVVGNQG